MLKNKKQHLKEVPLEGSTDSNVRITIQEDSYGHFIDTCQPHKCPFSSLQITASHRSNDRQILDFDGQKLGLVGQSLFLFSILWPTRLVSWPAKPGPFPVKWPPYSQKLFSGLLLEQVSRLQKKYFAWAATSSLQILRNYDGNSGNTPSNMKFSWQFALVRNWWPTYKWFEENEDNLLPKQFLLHRILPWNVW